MVKCAECGFLGIWDLKHREWLYADETFRATGDNDLGEFYPAFFYTKCFVLAAPLREEWAAEPGPASDTSTIVTVLHRERTCGKWTEWQPGFTPKEHREMLASREDREWRARREDADREWREQQRQKDLQWRSEQDAQASRAKRIEIGLTVLGIIIATGAIITAAYMQVNSQRQTTQMLIDATKPAIPPLLPAINE